MEQARERVPLSTLVSQVLIAFVIEFDNEFERQMPHRTTIAKTAGTRAPWLVSMAMWAKFLRFVDEDGSTIRDFARRAGLDRAGTRQWLIRLKRWGYVVIAPAAVDRRTNPSKGDGLIRPSRAGREALALWRPLPETIEQRWAQRFGAVTLANLYEALVILVSGFRDDLPDYLPILGYGWSIADGVRGREVRFDPSTSPPLVTLLSKVLLLLASEFEAESASEPSFAMGVTVLRVLTASPIPVGRLPSLTGVSKEAIAVALGFLAKRGLITLAAESSGRGRSICLTPRGKRAQSAFRARHAALEQNWELRFGQAEVGRVRAALEELLERRNGEQWCIAAGLQPHPGAWRTRPPYLAQTKAMLANPRAALPHFPLILHRGGYPDGS